MTPSNPTTFALPLTPRAPAAIAVILLAGPGAPVILQKIAANKKAPDLSVGQFCRSRLLDLSSPPKEIDDALILHTAPNDWELHTHGGIAVIDGLLATLQAAGAQILSPEQAEAHGLLGSGLAGELPLALSRAATPSALRLLLAQPAALERWSSHWLNWLSAPRRTAQDLWQFHSSVQWLLTRTKSLSRLLNPPRIAILGPPNAGKSTLANALLGRPISITSDLAGTTRDWVDAQAIFTATAIPKTVHVPVVLIDTAGIRETPDHLERQSIARSRAQAAAADALILLFDGTRPPSPEELTLLDPYRDIPHVLALSKSDLAPTPSHPSFHSALRISAKTTAGLPDLMTAVLLQLGLHHAADEPFGLNTRQQNLLESLAFTTDIATARDLLQSLAFPCFPSYVPVDHPSGLQ
jgi:tRNA modification GTPase